MSTTISSATTIGVQAHLVDIEVDLSVGMLRFDIVGLPDRAISESKQRIYTALKNSGIRLPERKITVNLAPADLKKEGTLFDLPIALGILHAAGDLALTQQFLHETLFIGELSLNGDVRPIKGALALASDAQLHNKKRLIVPQANAIEAALIKNVEVIGVKSLQELIDFLRGEITIVPTEQTDYKKFAVQLKNAEDFAQVKGQDQAKRALQIAAAGRHNILFIGPPGSGKTMLAKRLPTIMPPMSFSEIIATSKIYSISGKLGNKALVAQRPFRNPHHTISPAGLVGGGSNPQPGEISLTHNGILFLDELTEFKRDTLEVLRQPLENKTVRIARASHSIDYPASFLLVAALNPCPCGYLGDTKRRCLCSHDQIHRYLRKLSGPLLDRIDIQVHVSSVEYDTIKEAELGTSSATLYEDVKKSVATQVQRNKTCWNSALASDKIDQHCVLSPQAEVIIKKAFDALHLSMRGYHKILKVARTIADLAQSDIIEAVHIQEAIMYRSLDQTLEKMRT